MIQQIEKIYTYKIYYPLQRCVFFQYYYNDQTKQELREVLKFPIEKNIVTYQPDEVGLKNAPIYIDPSSHFVFYEILCSSNVT